MGDDDQANVADYRDYKIVKTDCNEAKKKVKPRQQKLLRGQSRS